MRIAAMVSCFYVLLACTACEKAGAAGDDLSRRVQALESKADALHKQAEDLRLKNRVAGSLLFRSPLDDFFNSPEFWEKTYDSGQADCAKRCISNNNDLRAACQKKPQSEQPACFADALARVTACQRGCSGL